MDTAHATLRTQVANGEACRCTQTVFPCMPVHTERDSDTDQRFTYSSGMVVTLTPWHHGPAASLRIRSKAYVELTCPWPERADMDVPMVVCMAVMMGKLGPVPSDEQIALWR